MLVDWLLWGSAGEEKDAEKTSCLVNSMMQRWTGEREILVFSGKHHYSDMGESQKRNDLPINL